MADTHTLVRVNVTLTPTDLAQLDSLASSRGLSRSAMLREIIRSHRPPFVSAPRKRTPEEVSASMDRLARKAGAWDPVSIIREWRERTR